MRFAFLQEPPFCFTDPSGALHGCDAKLAEKVCALLAEPFAPVETEFAELLPGLVDGRWDMTTGLFVSEERRMLVDFTRPIWMLADGLLVAKGNPRAFDGYRSVAEDQAALIRHHIRPDPTSRQPCKTVFRPSASRSSPRRLKRLTPSLPVRRMPMPASPWRIAAIVGRHPDAPLTVIDVPAAEKQPAAGAFALAKGNAALRRASIPASTMCWAVPGTAR